MVMAILIGSFILLVIFLILVIFLVVPSLLGAPWVPTQMNHVCKMLSMADVKLGDIVYDLGSGDGRVLLTAAKEFRARSVGIEMNPLWVLWTRWRIRILKLRDRVEVVWGNFFHKDLSEADVVTLYLLQGTNDRLREKLEKDLKPGARVVSRIYIFKGWRSLNADEKSKIYLYKIGNHREHT